jgi:hypothetical protein
LFEGIGRAVQAVANKPARTLVRTAGRMTVEAMHRNYHEAGAVPDARLGAGRYRR